MNINLKATGIELTDAIAEYATKKMQTLEKYLAPGATMQVEVGKTTHHHKQGQVFRAEVRIQGAGSDFYASREADDLYAAIDLVRDEMVHEITRKKGKRLSLLRQGGRMVKNTLRRWWK